MQTEGTVQVQVTLELGHTASCRKKPTVEGFTHDWKVFVRGQANCDVSHFVEKVQFRLHESFAKPKRVVKDPPYSVEQSGYGGFVLPVEIYFKNKEDPKKVQFNYDLFLPAIGLAPINNIRSEALTFTNPTEEFKKKLLKGGGIIIQNGLNGFHSASGPDSTTGDAASKRTGEVTHGQAAGVQAEADKVKKMKTEKADVNNSAKHQEQTDEKAPATSTAKKKPKKNPDAANSSKSSAVGFIPLELLAPDSDLKDKLEEVGDVKLKVKTLTPKSNGERKKETSSSSELSSMASSGKKRKLSTTGEGKGKKKSKDGTQAAKPRRRGSDDSSTSSSSSLIIGNIGSKSKNLALGALLKEMEVESEQDDDDDQLDVVTPFQSNCISQRDVKGCVNGLKPPSSASAVLKKDLKSLPAKVDKGETKNNGHLDKQDGWSAANGRHNGSCSEAPLKHSPYLGEEASLAQLLHLQKRLTATRDSCRLQKVVDILETTGAYSISDATLDFDLCALDKSTIKKIESCLER